MSLPIYQAEAIEVAELLKQGKVILYPTDTIWGLGCSVSNLAGIERISAIKNRPDSKQYIILVNSIEMLKMYVEEIHPRVETLLSLHLTPLTVIYPKAKNLDKGICASDGSIAIRICKEPFCSLMIESLGCPIISSSANVSGEKFPTHFGEISSEILQSVDYIVRHRQKELTPSQSSVIIKYDTDGEIILVRE